VRLRVFFASQQKDDTPNGTDSTEDIEDGWLNGKLVAAVTIGEAHQLTQPPAKPYSEANSPDSGMLMMVPNCAPAYTKAPILERSLGGIHFARSA